MGILYLPSLEEKRFIKLEDVSRTEAETFINRFVEDVKASRSLKTNNKPVADNFIEYNILSDVIDFDISEIFDSLIESSVPGFRGIRAVFVDLDTDAILVGTTVVYSRNWAVLGLLDETITDTLFDLESNW